MEHSNLSELLRKLAMSLRNPLGVPSTSVPRPKLEPPKLKTPSFSLMSQPSKVIPNPVTFKSENLNPAQAGTPGKTGTI